ncbi:MAG: threonine/serine exporter family protein [Duncaniella sp.]|nr:threonine/serine exporter family protein [Duncaniella sp.]
MYPHISRYPSSEEGRESRCTMHGHEPLAEICRFFTDYASVMLGCGATCQRIEKNLRRMASVDNLVVDMFILPAHVRVTVGQRDCLTCAELTLPVRKMAINYNYNTLLSKLSWKVAERRVSLKHAPAMMERMLEEPPFNKWYVMGAVVIANASFCRLFGGDGVAMLFVAIATLAGYALKNLMLAHHADPKIMFICCSFVAAMIGASAYYIAPTHTPELALGTSVLFLIPGIPYINSVSDMLAGHYLCAFSRLMNALILTACLALGLTAAFLIMDIKIF